MPSSIGHYLIVSTVHIHCATAELLEGWSRLAPGDRPLSVASTGFGWFIPTDQVDAMSAVTLPDELPAILSFGRACGCAHVLFDSDGPRIPDLDAFPW